MTSYIWGKWRTKPRNHAPSRIICVLWPVYGVLSLDLEFEMACGLRIFMVPFNPLFRFSIMLSRVFNQPTQLNNKKKTNYVWYCIIALLYHYFFFFLKALFPFRFHKKMNEICEKIIKAKPTWGRKFNELFFEFRLFMLFCHYSVPIIYTHFDFIHLVWSVSMYLMTNGWRLTFRFV